MNPTTGEKQIDIGGKACIMRFDWRALSEIENKYGENPNLFDAEVLAGVAAAGLRGKHPEMTAEVIMELSPPLAPFAQAVQEAIRWAYFGAEAVPEETGKKKARRRKDGPWRLLRKLWRRESPR